MPTGILAPSKIKDTKKLRLIYLKIAKILIGKDNRIIISPDTSSGAELFCKTFRSLGGKSTGIIYANDKENGYKGLSRDILNDEINCHTWENQPKELLVNSTRAIVLGYSPGVIAEICYTKFHWYGKKQNVYIIKELCKTKLPKELEEQLNLKYVSISQLKKTLV